MAQVSGQGTIWNLPNYAGQLFTADAESTPMLTMLGGLTGGAQTQDFQFPTASLYDYPAAAQPAITEDTSASAGTGTEYVRTQESNVTQIFQEYVEITYVKMSNKHRLSGLNTQGQVNNAEAELDFQVNTTLKKIARDVEYTLLNGVYQISTASNVANKTRGVIAAASNSVDATAAALSKDLMDQLFKLMADNGAIFSIPVIFVNSFQKQKLTDIYNGVTGFNLPATRDVGGLNITTIEFDFGVAGIVYDRFMPQGTLLVAEMSVLDVVFQPVEGKGNFFLEEQAKTGASEKHMIFGQLGLDHGPGFMHGVIINLATS